MFEHHPSKEEQSTPMMEQIDDLNDKADKIKEACRIRRSATRRSLDLLYDLLAGKEDDKEEIFAEAKPEVNEDSQPEGGTK